MLEIGIIRLGKYAWYSHLQYGCYHMYLCLKLLTNMPKMPRQ